MRFILIAVCVLSTAFANAQVDEVSDRERHYHRGLKWFFESNYDKAIKDFDEAIRLDPKHSRAYYSRGNAWDKKGEYDKAIQDYNEAIRLNPKYADAYYSRGIAWKANGEYDKAIKDFNEAIRLNPKDMIAYNNLAFLMASCPEAKCRNGAMALKHAKKACELSGWQYADCVDTLAAAYAETGNFTEAIKRQQQAIELAPKDKKDDYKAKLELYKQGKPFREKPKK